MGLRLDILRQKLQSVLGHAPAAQPPPDTLTSADDLRVLFADGETTLPDPARVNAQTTRSVTTEQATAPPAPEPPQPRAPAHPGAPALFQDFNWD